MLFFCCFSKNSQLRNDDSGLSIHLIAYSVKYLPILRAVPADNSCPVRQLSLRHWVPLDSWFLLLNCVFTGQCPQTIHARCRSLLNRTFSQNACHWDSRTVPLSTLSVPRRGDHGSHVILFHSCRAGACSRHCPSSPPCTYYLSIPPVGTAIGRPPFHSAPQ